MANLPALRRLERRSRSIAEGVYAQFDRAVVVTDGQGCSLCIRRWRDPPSTVSEGFWLGDLLMRCNTSGGYSTSWSVIPSADLQAVRWTSASASGSAVAYRWR